MPGAERLTRQVPGAGEYRAAVTQLAKRFLVDEVTKATPVWLRSEIAQVAHAHRVCGPQVFDDLIRSIAINWFRMPPVVLIRDLGDKLARVARISAYLLWQRLYGYRRPPPRTFAPVESVVRSKESGPAPRVSIVILSYNRLNYLKSTLAALYATAGYDHFELIVVDNGSSDGSVDYLESLHTIGQIDKLVLSARNLGTSGGYNCGFAHAAPGSDFLMKLDSDIVTLTPGWLQEIVSCFDQQPSLGLAALTVCNHAGLRNLPVVTRAGRRVKPMWYGIMGAAGFTFRRELFRNVGYFNQDFDYAYMPDDIDYVYRVIAEGYDAYYLADFHAFERRDQDRGRYLSYERTKKAKPPMTLMRAYFSGEKDARIFYRQYESLATSVPRLVRALSDDAAARLMGKVSL